MARKPTEPTPMADLMQKLIAGRGWGENLALGRLRDGWPGIVGELLAERSEPVRLSAGVLSVRAEAGAWASELALLAPVVATKANAFLGTGLVRDVRVAAGTVGSPPQGS